MRNRFFAEYAGLTPTILTFDPKPVYPGERERLTDRGELVAGMRLLNSYEFYRDEAVVSGPPLAESLPELSGLLAIDVAHPDGSTYYTGYRRPGSDDDVVLDFRRPDGSIYLRTPGRGVKQDRSPWILTDRQSRPVHIWPKRLGWSHHWLRTLLGDGDRAFVISDGRFSVEKVMPFRDERFHMIHLMHNVHIHGSRQWNVPLSPTYVFLLSLISELDGLVSLTSRQRADIAERFGATNNLFDVANPVVLPARPQPLPERERARFAMVTRFHPQKRVDHAVRAFRLVVSERPQAQLLIYGDGETASSVRSLIDKLHLQDNVSLCGWDSDARDTLWTATGFLLTSAHEGYPLATLESMSRGCPVIAYDIKYGPREQISSGVDGFLVPDADQQAMAHRIVEMIDDAGLVRSLSSAALESAQHHDYRAFLKGWQDILSTVAANKPHRVRLSRVDCTVTRLGYAPAPRRSRWIYRIRPRRRRSRPILLEADLVVRGRSTGDALDEAELTLDAISDTTDRVTNLPLEVRRKGRRFRVSSRFTLDDIFTDRPAEDRSVTLRLRLVLRNASWETAITGPTAHAPDPEFSFDDSGVLHLRLV